MEFGLSVNFRSEDSSTPLGSVAASGSTQVAKLLVENGALVNPPVPASNKAYVSQPYWSDL